MLTADQPLSIARETLSEGKRGGSSPLCYAVLDRRGGHRLARALAKHGTHTLCVE